MAPSPSKRARHVGPTVNVGADALGTIRIPARVSPTLVSYESQPTGAASVRPSELNVADSADHGDDAKWACPECGQVFLQTSGQATNLIRLEHQDYHVATRLQHEFDKSGSIGPETTRPLRNEARAQRDIRSFFAKGS